MKAVILNASAWMIVPFMDAFAKYLSSSMDVLQITWARYFFTVVFALFIMLIFDRKSLVWSKKPLLQLIRGLIFVFSTYLFFYAISEISLPNNALVKIWDTDLLAPSNKFCSSAGIYLETSWFNLFIKSLPIPAHWQTHRALPSIKCAPLIQDPNTHCVY